MVWPYTTDGFAVDHDAAHAAEDRCYDNLDTLPLTNEADRVTEDVKEQTNG